MTTRVTFEEAAAAIAMPDSWEAEIAKPGEAAYRKTTPKPAAKPAAAGVSFDDAYRAIAMPDSWETKIAKPGEVAYCVAHGQFACHDASCRPPGSGGTGGSLPGGGGVGPALGPALPGDKPKNVRDTRATDYGLSYEPGNDKLPEIAQARKFTGWQDLPTRQIDITGGQLHATEEFLSSRPVRKVLEGEPLREGYDPQVVIMPDGTAYIADGHHRAAMYAGLGRTTMPAKVLDLSVHGTVAKAIAAAEADATTPEKIKPLHELTVLDRPLTVCAAHGAFACHDPSCRPPSSGGTGGSLPAASTGGSDTLGEQYPPTDTRDVHDLVTFPPGPNGERFRETFDRLATLHRAPIDPPTGMQLAPTEIVDGGKSDTGKGGHFSPAMPGAPILKPRRRKNETPAEYMGRVRQYYSNPHNLRPEILVLDRGDKTDRVSLIHEFGHRIDYTPPATGVLRNDNQGTWHSDAAFKQTVTDSNVTTVYADTAMGRLMKHAHTTDSIKGAYERFHGDRDFIQYFNDPHEIWARAYSQWAANRLGGIERKHLQNGHPDYKWSDEAFEPMMQLVEDVMRERGLMP